jgi:hypothetical protein
MEGNSRVESYLKMHNNVLVLPLVDSYNSVSIVTKGNENILLSVMVDGKT